MLDASIRCALISFWLAFFGLASPMPSAAAASSPYDSLRFEQRMLVQDLLMWSGDYDGMVDGVIGPRSLKAVETFQNRLGERADGVLTGDQFGHLADVATAARMQAGWHVFDDPDVGLRFGLPGAVVQWRGQNDLRGDIYSDEYGRFRVITFVFADAPPAGLELLPVLLVQNVSGVEQGYTRVRQDWMVTSGRDPGEVYYAKAVWTNGEIRGFIVWFDRALKSTHARYVTAIANSLDVIPRLPRSGGAPNGPVQASAKMPETRAEARGPSSGTGFIVEGGGLVVTNAHVVMDCAQVTVAPYETATVLRIDPVRDLALVHAAGLAGRPAAVIADDDVLLGEDVFAFGFPLADVLGDALGFSRGSVSSLSGLHGDRVNFRMTAQVQPGNSGGPLVDASGRVVGVVVAKLDALAVASRTGDIPQSMNFAVKASELRAFLSEIGVSGAAMLPRRMSAKSPTDLAVEAERFTVQVLCR